MRPPACGRCTHGCRGARAAGTPYSALDPELLMWVHATLVDTALLVYGQWVRPLGQEEQAGYYEEMKIAARLFGTPDEVMPATLERLPRLHAADARRADDLCRRDGSRDRRVGHASSAAARRCARRWSSPISSRPDWCPRGCGRSTASRGILLGAAIVAASRERERCRLLMPLLPSRLRTVSCADILRADEGLGRERHGHARGARRGRGAAQARSRADRRTARWPRASATTGPGPASGPRATSRRARPSRASSAAGPGTGASIAANKVAGVRAALCARRRDRARRAHLERRQRARAQPALDLRAGAGGDPRRLVRDRAQRRPEDRANVEHVAELDAERAGA